MELPRSSAYINALEKTISVGAKKYMSYLKSMLCVILCGTKKMDEDENVEKIKLSHSLLDAETNNETSDKVDIATNMVKEVLQIRNLR